VAGWQWARCIAGTRAVILSGDTMYVVHLTHADTRAHNSTHSSTVTLPTHCHTLRCTATHCYALLCTATLPPFHPPTATLPLPHTATHCHTLPLPPNPLPTNHPLPPNPLPPTVTHCHTLPLPPNPLPTNHPLPLPPNPDYPQALAHLPRGRHSPGPRHPPQ
jgi:hypothetical protein